MHSLRLPTVLLLAGVVAVAALGAARAVDARLGCPGADGPWVFRTVGWFTEPELRTVHRVVMDDGRVVILEVGAPPSSSNRTFVDLSEIEHSEATRLAMTLGADAERLDRALAGTLPGSEMRELEARLAQAILVAKCEYETPPSCLDGTQHAWELRAWGLSKRVTTNGCGNPRPIERVAEFLNDDFERIRGAHDAWT